MLCNTLTKAQYICVGHTSAITAFAILTNPDDEKSVNNGAAGSTDLPEGIIATAQGGAQSAFYLWNLVTQQLLTIVPSPLVINWLAWSPDGQSLVRMYFVLSESFACYSLQSNGTVLAPLCHYIALPPQHTMLTLNFLHLLFYL